MTNGHTDIAVQIKDLLAANHTLEVSDIATSLGIDEILVTEILNSFTPTDTSVEELGNGLGHGWVPMHDFILESTFSGYRWPDGSLNPDPWVG